MSVIAKIRDVVFQLVAGNINAQEATVQLVVMMKLREMKVSNMTNNHRTSNTDVGTTSKEPENSGGRI